MPNQAIDPVVFCQYCSPNSTPMPKILAILASTVLMASSAMAQEIKLLGLGGDLWSVDPRNGDLSFIGLTGLNTYLWNSMAMDNQGHLYGAYGRFDFPYAIYEIDPQTAQATFVVQTNFIGIRAMAFDDNDVLYISNDRDAPASFSPTDIHTLDLATGATTYLGETGTVSMNTMEFSNGILWGYAFQRGLIQISTVDGHATDVNPIFWGPWNATSSMCFDDQGALYFLDTYLWMFDTQTAVASLVNPLSLFGYWADAAFVEGQTPTFTLWLAGTTGGPAGIKVSGATPGDTIAFAWAPGGGGPTPIPSGFPCAGVQLDLNASMQLLGTITANSQGKGFLGPQFLPAAAIDLIRVQAIDLTTCTTSNRVTVAF